MINLAPPIGMTLQRICPLSPDEYATVRELLTLDIPHLAATENPVLWIVTDLAGKPTSRAVKCTPNTARAVNAAIIQRN